MENKTVNVLGTDYEIVYQTEQENPKLKDSNGLCEQYGRKIVIEHPSAYENNPMTVENIEEFTKKVIRHEIVHAFLGESGLRGNSDWAQNEEMVDWIAIQFTKMLKAFEDAQAI